MQNPFPKKCDPWQAADRNKLFEFNIETNKLSRLKFAGNSTSWLKASFDFYREDRKALLEIKLTGELSLECQRCLQPLLTPFSSKNTLVMVKGEQEATKLSAHYEPVLVDDTDLITLLDLVEDEILLGLPQIVKHKECQLTYKMASQNNTMAIEPEKKENPFAVLQQLKK